MEKVKREFSVSRMGKEVIDPFQMILVAITVFSALFVAITGGLKATLGYRGSAETADRKKRIDTKLGEEIEAQINQFIESDECRKDGEKRIEGFQELGYRSIVAENITTDLLDKATSVMGKSLKILLGATVMAFLTIYLPFYLDLAQTLNATIFLVYLALAIIYSWMTISNFRRAHFLMERLILLDENTNLEYACDLHTDLLERGLI